MLSSKISRLVADGSSREAFVVVFYVLPHEGEDLVCDGPAAGKAGLVAFLVEAAGRDAA